MVWTKACPRCRGDMVRMDDDYEPYLSCLQCGHTVYQVADLNRALAAARSVPDPDKRAEAS